MKTEQRVPIAEFDTATKEIVKVSVSAIPAMQELANPTAIQKIEALIQPNIDEALLVKVKDNETRETAFFWARTIKPFSKKLDDARRAINKVIKEEVDNRFQPTISRIDEAVGHAEGELRRYDEEQVEKARKLQREADEQRAKEQAELERRRKIQRAAVDAGKEARTEIPVEAPKTEIAKPAVVAEDKRVHYRLRYEVVDVDSLPAGYFKKVADPTAINRKALAIEEGFTKDRKGIDEPPQLVPGVKFFWKSEYRMV